MGPDGHQTREAASELSRGSGAQRKDLDAPDEVRSFPNGIGQLVHVGLLTIGRGILEPGWRWMTPRQGKIVKRPPPVGRTTPKCRRSRVAIVRVRYRPARTTFDASATPIDWSA